VVTCNYYRVVDTERKSVRDFDDPEDLDSDDWYCRNCNRNISRNDKDLAKKIDAAFWSCV
jgi:hypothetical protein